MHTLRDVLAGVMTGGFALSAAWGLFWLAVGTVGLSRRTCGWRVIANSAVVVAVPLLLVSVLWWMRGSAPPPNAAFLGGLAVMPLALGGLGLRRAPDGRRAGAHMLEGVRHLMDDVLGKHHDCGGCGHDHGPHESGGCG